MSKSNSSCWAHWNFLDRWVWWAVLPGAPPAAPGTRIFQPEGLCYRVQNCLSWCLLNQYVKLRLVFLMQKTSVVPYLLQIFLLWGSLERNRLWLPSVQKSLFAVFCPPCREANCSVKSFFLLSTRGCSTRTYLLPCVCFFPSLYSPACVLLCPLSCISTQQMRRHVGQRAPPSTGGLHLCLNQRAEGKYS